MTQFTDAPIFDADQHMYETPDALTRHLPERYRQAVQFVQVGKRTRIAILNKITEYIPNPTFERVAAPGAYEPFFSGRNVEGKSLRELGGRGIDALPAFREPGPRIAVLDEQGVDEALVYPTLANLVEHSAAEDPELVVAMIRALGQPVLGRLGRRRRRHRRLGPGAVRVGLPAPGGPARAARLLRAHVNRPDRPARRPGAGQVTGQRLARGDALGRAHDPT